MSAGQRVSSAEPAESAAMGAADARPGLRGGCRWRLWLFVGLLGPGLGGAWPDFQQNLHLSSYEIITPWKLIRDRREAPTPYSKKVSYVIPIEGKEYIVHLERNNNLLPKDFVVYTYNKEGALISDYPDVQNHCHYRGYVEGAYNSSVALNNCFGLRGLLHMEDMSYGIEPLQNSSHFEHIFYPMDDIHKEPLKCGVFNNDIEEEMAKDEEEQPSDTTHLLRRRRAILPQTRYVELFIVVDKERYDMMGKNQTAVREEMIRLANYLDSMYIMLNIRVVLVGLEIWTNGNLISIIGGAGDVLANFVQWREKFLITRRRHDSAQLVLKKGFGGTAGMAFVGTVCSRSHAGGINVFGQITVETFASIVAHELGHNLGMNHDDGRDCFCGAKSCIMNSGASNVSWTLVVKEVLVSLSNLLNVHMVTVAKIVGFFQEVLYVEEKLMNVMFQNIAMVHLSSVNQMFLFRMDILARTTKPIATMACANIMMLSVKSSLAQKPRLPQEIVSLM